MSDIASDRQWVVELYKTNEGRNPTTAELDADVQKLQSGYTRDSLVKESDRYGDVEGWVTRQIKDVYGRDPIPGEVSAIAANIRNGKYGRTDVRNWLQSTDEAVLHANSPKPPAGPTADQQDAKAMMSDTLHQYGLDSMSDWAWSEIQSGKTLTQVQQELQQRPEFKARFPAMDQRIAKGLPPITPGQYIQNEGLYRDIMRSNGMPPGFWDNPSDYTSLIANDISPTELQTRVQQGWAKVTTAPPEVRAAFAQYFGVEGDTALASYFIDPSKSEAMLVKAADEARTGGFATLFGMPLSEQRASQIYDFGKTSDQAIQAFNQISQISPLFSETVSENQDLTKQQEGINAALGMDATSQTELDTRLHTRQAALSGGGGALIGTKGVGAGTASNG